MNSMYTNIYLNVSSWAGMGGGAKSYFEIPDGVMKCLYNCFFLAIIYAFIDIFHNNLCLLFIGGLQYYNRRRYSVIQKYEKFVSLLIFNII